jgi:hypothetical protein
MRKSSLFTRFQRAALSAVWIFVWHVAPAASAATDAEVAATFAAQVQASMTALEDGARDAPRDHWDPQYVVDTVGLEAEDLYRWVRDSVAWMPYRGILRGPEGVLMDRTGNGLDRALLLARLLTLAGHDVRLARATLSPETARSAWDRLVAGRTTPPAAAGPLESLAADANPIREDELLVTADLYGIDRAIVGTLVSATNSEAEGLSQTMSDRVAGQTESLAAMVGGLDGDAIAAAVLAEAMASLADHWWVQVERDGAFVDLDLMAQDGSGAALAPAADTFAPDALPADLEQRVVIRVVAEQLKDGALSEHVTVEQSLRPRDLYGATIGFRHFPMAWPQDWPQVTPDDIQIKLRAALLTQTEWMPVLVAGDVVVGTVGVFDTGEIDPSPKPVDPFTQMTVAMTGMVSKATDVLATGADPDALIDRDAGLDTPRPPRAEGELVAERLEFEVQVPGLDPITHRRDLFDLIGPAERATGDLSRFAMSGQKALDRSMAMMAESEIQILPARLAPEFLTYLAAENAIGNRPVLDELGRDPFGRVPSNYMELFSKLNGLPAALYSLASLRFALNPWSDWVFVDRPSVVAQHVRLTRGGGGDFVAGVGLDIVENGVGVDPLAAAWAAALRIGQGVADTNAESLSLTKTGKVSANAADAFAASPDTAGWRLVAPADASSLAALGYAPDDAARIAAELAAGRLVAAPPPPADGGRLDGWWRIDPTTGTTLGIGVSGHGQAMVEYALIILIETMMAAAQCALEGAVDRFMERTLAEKARGADSGHATAAGAKNAYADAMKKLGNAQQRNHCIASGMFAGFKSLLLGFAMNAVKTSGNKGHDGSKPPPSWERKAVENQMKAGSGGSRAGSGTPVARSGGTGLPPAGSGPGRPPAGSGSGRPPAPPPRSTPSEPSSGGPQGKPASKPAADAETPPKTAPPLPKAPPQSPHDRFIEAQQRAFEAEQRLKNHNPIDTPEGRAETDRLWNDLNKANRDKILARDGVPVNQRGGLPPDPVAGSDFSGYKTGEGPPSKVPQTEPGGSDFKGYDTGAGPPAPAGGAPSQRPTRTSEGPESEIPVVTPRRLPPDPTVDELLSGLDGRGPPTATGARPAPAGSQASVEQLLSGLDGRRDAGAMPQPATPRPAPGGQGLAAGTPNGGEQAKLTGLAGLVGTLETITEP